MAATETAPTILRACTAVAWTASPIASVPRFSAASALRPCSPSIESSSSRCSSILRRTSEIATSRVVDIESNGGLMSEHKVVVVGTDGSESSFRAVDRAAAIAAESNAKLVVATAYLSEEELRSGEPDQPKGEHYRTEGNAPVYGMLREAADRARAAGATDIEEKAISGAPVDVLVKLVDDVDADLLVVGNVGVKSIAGRLLGSVPTAVRKRANTEVLVVETDD
jgi:nucleotide-binding universal stress UspA family protein